MNETSLIKPSGAAPISSMDQVAYNYYSATPIEETSSIRENWRKIRKRKWLVLAVTVIVTTIVTVESFRTKTTYQATAKVALTNDNPAIFKLGATTLGVDNNDRLKTEMLLLRTYPLLAKVIVRYGLDEDPAFLQADERRTMMEAARAIIAKFTGAISQKGGQENAGGQPAFDSPPPQIDGPLSPEEVERLASYIARLDDSLYVSQIEETRAIQISFTHTDPGVAAKVANGVAQVFVDESFSNKTARSSSSATWLDRTTRQLKAQMEEAERNLADYSRNNGIFFSTDEKQNLVVGKLADLYDKVLKADMNANSKESLYDEVKEGRVTRLPEAFSDPGITQNQGKLGGLRIELAQLTATFGPENPNVLKVRSQIAELERLIAESTKNLGDRLKAEAERASREEKLLKGSFEVAKAEAVEQNQAAIKFNILKQNVDTTKALYNDFLQKTNQAQIEQQHDANDMRIIDPARAAPVGPRRGRAIFIGFMLSLAAGVGLALLLEHLDNTVKNVEDVARAAQLPTLALIPSMNADSMLPVAGRKNDWQQMIKSGAAKLGGPGGLLARGMQPPGDNPAALGTSSSVVESYRMLRTSILLSTAGAPPKTILITSSQPGEGKTTTAVNTAISLSQLGASVLLIDADLRRPAVHTAFKITRDRGISNYLSGHAPLDDLIVKLPIPNLYVLPCGPIPPNPAELISSNRMKELLRELGQRFDHILIDSPPMVSVTDPVILSTMVDGSILVVQAGRSTRELARRARRELARVGARVFGVVLNNVDVRREGYDYYDYYRYASGHNEGHRGTSEG
ncbi:MAG TPA: polysaccharide biosynthesis tyrosine autokinase [Blastocatellia bacterium]|nr:polysaccharide biosynthesis tyrosine autokinase [Blastocatellia bacterium]